MNAFEKLKDEIVRTLAVLPVSEETLKLTIAPSWIVPYALRSLLLERRITKRAHSALYRLNTRAKLG